MTAPPSAEPYDAVFAQHEETGRIWHGRRKDIPRRYQECAEPPAAQPAEPPATDNLVERIRALADCAYWANAGWDIPGDATQQIGRLAVKAADLIERQAREIADMVERDKLALAAVDGVGRLRLTIAAQTQRAERAEAERDAARLQNDTQASLMDGLREDAEKWRAYEERKRKVIAAGMGRNPLRADAARAGK